MTDALQRSTRIPMAASWPVIRRLMVRYRKCVRVPWRIRRARASALSQPPPNSSTDDARFEHHPHLCRRRCLPVKEEIYRVAARHGLPVSRGRPASSSG